MTKATAAQIAATRHLIGLSQAELAEALSVNRHAVKDWESGRFTARPGVISDLAILRAEHDAEVARILTEAGRGVPIELPRAPRPQGWYLALGARVIAAEPSAVIVWAE